MGPRPPTGLTAVGPPGAGTNAPATGAPTGTPPGMGAEQVNSSSSKQERNAK
jgi:hypothetical protein